MQQIKFPKELLSMYSPWNTLSNNLRLEKSKILCRSEENISHSLESLLVSEGSNIPEDLSEYWGFAAESIAQKVDSFDSLNYDLLQEIIDSYQAGPSSDQMLEEMAEMWIWTTALDIADDILRWLRNNLDKNKDFGYIESLLKITTKYWKKVPHDLSSSLISASYALSKESALVMLEEVENTSPIQSQRELARDYRKMTLESLTN